MARIRTPAAPYSKETIRGDRITNGLALGTGPITFNGSGGFTIPSSGVTNWNANPNNNNYVVNGTGNVVSWQTSVNPGTGTWTGSGTLTIGISFSPTITFAGDMTSFQGTLILQAPANTTNTDELPVYKLNDHRRE